MRTYLPGPADAGAAGGQAASNDATHPLSFDLGLAARDDGSDVDELIENRSYRPLQRSQKRDQRADSVVTQVSRGVLNVAHGGLEVSCEVIQVFHETLAHPVVIEQDHRV